MGEQDTLNSQIVSMLCCAVLGGVVRLLLFDITCHVMVAWQHQQGCVLPARHLLLDGVERNDR